MDLYNRRFFEEKLKIIDTKNLPSIFVLFDGLKKTRIN